VPVIKRMGRVIKMGVKGAKSLALLGAGMDSPLIESFKYFFAKTNITTINLLRNAGWEPPLVPVELRPLPVALCYGQGGAMKQEALPYKAG